MTHHSNETSCCKLHDKSDTATVINHCRAYRTGQNSRYNFKNEVTFFFRPKKKKKQVESID